MNLSTRMKIFSVAASASLITLALPTTRAQSPSDPNSRYFTAAWNKNPPEDRVYKYDIYATPTEEVIEQLEALGGPTYFPGLIFAADETNPPASGMWLNQMNAGTSLMQFDPEREPTVLTANGRSTVHFNNDWMSATLPFNRDQGLTIFSVFESDVTSPDPTPARPNNVILELGTFINANQRPKIEINQDSANLRRIYSGSNGTGAIGKFTTASGRTVIVETIEPGINGRVRSYNGSTMEQFWAGTGTTTRIDMTNALLTIGRSLGSPDKFWKGRFIGVYIYDNRMLDADIYQLQSYLGRVMANATPVYRVGTVLNPETIDERTPEELAACAADTRCVSKTSEEMAIFCAEYNEDTNSICIRTKIPGQFDGQNNNIYVYAIGPNPDRRRSGASDPAILYPR